MLGLFAAGIHIYAELPHIAGTHIHIVPVGVSSCVSIILIVLIREIGQVIAGIDPAGFGQSPPLLGIEQLDEGGFVHSGNAVFHRGTHVQMAVALALLGSDQNNAVGAVGTIDRGGGGILEHGDGLNVVGIDKRHRAHSIADTV